MTRRLRIGLSLLATSLPVALTTATQSTTAVIEVSAVTPAGDPVVDLTKDSFSVSIDATPRTVLAAERDSAHAPFLIAVDQTSLPASAAPAAREAARRVLSSVAATDRVGLVAFPRGTS